MGVKLIRLFHADAANLLDQNSQERDVVGSALFYLPTTSWERVNPGELGLSKLFGAQGSFPNQNAGTDVKSTVEFYISEDNSNGELDSYIGINASHTDWVSVGFFGKRYR